MARRIVSAREQVEMLSPWRTAAEDPTPPSIHDIMPGRFSDGNGRWNHRHQETSGDSYLRHEYGIHPISSPASHSYVDDWGKTHTVHYDPALTGGQLPRPGKFGHEWDDHSALRNEITELAPPPGMLWRGMSREEYEKSRERGYFESEGGHNFDSQQGLTFFSTNPEQAANYATWFAPQAYKPTFTHPGYVVGVPDRPDAPRGAIPGQTEIGSTEVGLPGRIPFSEATHHYVGQVSTLRPGTQGVSEGWHGWEESGGSHPSSTIVWSQIHPGQHIAARLAERADDLRWERDSSGNWILVTRNPDGNPVAVRTERAPSVRTSHRIAAATQWYHTSPHRLPVGTELTPGGGRSPHDPYYRAVGLSRLPLIGTPAPKVAAATDHPDEGWQPRGWWDHPSMSEESRDAFERADRRNNPHLYEEQPEPDPNATAHYYHITDKPDFSLDPNYHPQDMWGDGDVRPGVYLSKNPRTWRDNYAWGGKRPYTVEFEGPADLHTRPLVGQPIPWDDQHLDDELYVPFSMFHLLKQKRIYRDAARGRVAADGWGSLSPEDRVSVAENVMERSGFGGKIFHVPTAYLKDAERLGMFDHLGRPDAHSLQRQHSKEAEDYVNGVLESRGYRFVPPEPYAEARPLQGDPIRVEPEHWDLREPGSGQAFTDGYSKIGLAGNHVNQLTLLHEAAHILHGTPHQGRREGHGPNFQQTLHGLYREHLGPEAADIFAGIAFPDQRQARLAMPEAIGSGKPLPGYEEHMRKVYDQYPPDSPTLPDSLKPHLMLPTDIAHHYREYDRPDDENTQMLKRVIADQGIRQPLKISTDGNHALMIEGNHRVSVARQLGMTHVPVQVFLEKPGKVMVNSESSSPVPLEPVLANWIDRNRHTLRSFWD